VNILHLLGSFRLPKDPEQESASGVVRVALELARLQVQEGHHVVLACIGKEAWQTTWQGVNLHSLTPLPWARVTVLGRTVDVSRHLPFVLLSWRQSFDVIHSHLYYYLRGLRAKARIAHVHGDPLHQGMGDHKVGMSKADFALLEQTASSFVAVSQFIAQRLRQGLSSTSIVHVVYNGVNFERFAMSDSVRKQSRQTWRQTWQAAEDATIYAYVGAVVPEKGVLQLARAFAKIEAGRDDVHLVVIGSSSLWGTSQQTRDPHAGYEAEIRDVLASANQRGHAHFMGKVPPKQVAQLLAASNVLVVPSIWQEPAALVILEAFAAGLPAIVSRVGGIPEMAAHGRHQLLAAGDEAALEASLAAAADGTLQYASPQEVQTTSNQVDLSLKTSSSSQLPVNNVDGTTAQTSFQQLQDYFSWQRTLNEIMAVYQQALNN
jgi:glycosyltransferase involved in cell wall biosynthesis